MRPNFCVRARKTVVTAPIFYTDFCQHTIFAIFRFYRGMPWYWQIVTQCPILSNPGTDETMVCSWNYVLPQQAQYIENNQPGDQTFSLDVAHYLRKTLKYRIPTIQPQEVCQYAFMYILNIFSQYLYIRHVLLVLSNNFHITSCLTSSYINHCIILLTEYL